jgi:hypothetical protein
MKITALGLTCLLLLTSCSSSHTLEDQIKLIEYEKCLSAQETLFSIAMQKGTRDEVFGILGVIKDPMVAKFIEKCKNYRP